MKRLELFSWRIPHGDGRESFSRMSLEDGRTIGAELVHGSAVFIDYPESQDELIDSWLTGETFKVVAEPIAVRWAA